jgi:hypothetical protein
VELYRGVIVRVCVYWLGSFGVLRFVVMWGLISRFLIVRLFIMRLLIVWGWFMVMLFDRRGSGWCWWMKVFLVFFIFSVLFIAVVMVVLS